MPVATLDTDCPNGKNSVTSVTIDCCDGFNSNATILRGEEVLFDDDVQDCSLRLTVYGDDESMALGAYFVRMGSVLLRASVSKNGYGLGAREGLIRRMLGLLDQLDNTPLPGDEEYHTDDSDPDDGLEELAGWVEHDPDAPPADTIEAVAQAMYEEEGPGQRVPSAYREILNDWISGRGGEDRVQRSISTWGCATRIRALIRNSRAVKS